MSGLQAEVQTRDLSNAKDESCPFDCNVQSHRNQTATVLDTGLNSKSGYVYRSVSFFIGDQSYKHQSVIRTGFKFCMHQGPIQRSLESRTISSWNTALLQMVIVSQLVEEFSVFDPIRRSERLPMYPILGQLNSIHILRSICKTSLYTILTSTGGKEFVLSLHYLPLISMNGKGVS
jgi:hypothetical protein